MILVSGSSADGGAAATAGGDVIREAFPDVEVSAVDPADIAAVAVRMLGEALNRPLTLDPFTDEEARADMSRTMPPEYVEAFMAFYADGTLDESMVLPTVEQVTGRPPRTFAQWAREHAHAFA